jgi:indole-3-glycerol phosphate synthase
MSADLLGAVVAAAERSALERERLVSLAEVEQAVAGRRPDGRAFRAALAAPGVRVIAECKRRSPSRGVLRADYDPMAIAKSYERAGAAAISVLTEPTFFDGSLDHLRCVRGSVTTPLLRKDFVVSDYQVVEAAACGADAVLLIVAALETPRLEALIGLAEATGLAALVEVHDRDELARALGSGASIIGVNSRNLRTLDVDQTVFDDLRPEMSTDVIAVAESGLRLASDLQRLSGLGYDAFLIGERFMIEVDPGTALRSLLEQAVRGSR